MISFYNMVICFTFRLLSQTSKFKERYSLSFTMKLLMYNKYFKICDDYHGLVSKAAVLPFKQSYNKRMSYWHNWVSVFTKNKMRLVPTTACLQTSNTTSENPGCSSKIKAMQFQQDYGFGLSEYTLLYSHNECKS